MVNQQNNYTWSANHFLIRIGLVIVSSLGQWTGNMCTFLLGYSLPPNFVLIELFFFLEEWEFRVLMIITMTVFLCKFA